MKRPLGRSIMRKIVQPLLAFAILLSLVTPLLADTIRLKDGSVIRGQVIGFKDQQFTILIGGNSKGRRGQTTVYVEDVESIEFDNNSGPASSQTDDSSAQSNGPFRPSQQNTQTEVPASSGRNNDSTTSTNPNPNPTFFTIKVSVRGDASNNGWTNSGLVVRKGQRLRITASGR